MYRLDAREVVKSTGPDQVLVSSVGDEEDLNGKEIGEKMCLNR